MVLESFMVSEDVPKRSTPARLELSRIELWSFITIVLPLEWNRHPE
jgi:hypothetical protein